MKAPPARLRRLLALVLPAGERAAIVGEMDELYRIRAEREGAAAADSWYRRQVGAFLRARIAGGWRRGTAGAATDRRLRRGAGGRAREGIVHDVRSAWRQMVRRPVGTVVALSVLALGIGGGTAVFSVVDGVLMRPLPFPDSGRLVRIQEVMTESGARVGLAPPAHLLFQSTDLRSLEGTAVVTSGGLDLEGEGDPEHLPVAFVSHGFFELLSVPPRAGRTFTAEEDRAGAPPVVVLSQGLWAQRFGADAGIVGRPIRLGGVQRTVIGVMPRRFDHPSGVAAWLPVSEELQGMEEVWGAMFLEGIGRLRRGAEPGAATAELTSLLRTRPEAARYEAEATSLHDELTAGVRRPLLILLAAVVLVLLVACANVGSLLLARAMERRRELAVRTALGASRRRLATTLLTESLLLAAVAGMVGVLVAYALVPSLLALAPGDLPRASGIGVDTRTLLFAVAATLATGLAAGILPAVRVRPDVVPALKEAGGSHTEGGRSSRARSALVVSQVAVTVVLLTGAGLLAGSFLRLMRQDTGFDPDGLAAVDLSLPTHRYPAEGDLLAFYAELVERAGAVPGIDGVAVSRNLPMAGRNLSAPVLRPGGDPVGRTVHVAATPGYLELMGTRIVRGLSFSRADVQAGRRPAVLSEALARELFRGDDPVGERVVTLFGRDTMEVVGVAENVRFASLRDDPGPVLYRPLSHWPSRGVHLVVRSTLPPAALFPALRTVVADVRPGQPIREMVTMPTLLGRTAARPRFYAVLLTAFAAIALLLSVIGFYGLLLSDLARQRREIGIRLALGAGHRRVAGRIAARAAALAGGGVLLGIIAAVSLGRVVEGLLFGVRARDPATLAAVVIVLLGASLLAALPAMLRASRVDPASELAS